MEKKLTVQTIFSESFVILLKNFLSILGAVVLWVLTLWIPYINVGTTIAIATLPIELSKGNVMSPTSIFDKKYRKYMGEYFILNGLITIAIIPAALFLIVPAIVLQISWSLAVYLLLDKGIDPSEAIVKSNELTYGYKWTIFLGKIAIVIAAGIIVWILSYISEFLAGLALIILSPIFVAANAVIYKHLALENTEETQSTEI